MSSRCHRCHHRTRLQPPPLSWTHRCPWFTCPQTNEPLRCAPTRRCRLGLEEGGGRCRAMPAWPADAHACAMVRPSVRAERADCAARVCSAANGRAGGSTRGHCGHVPGEHDARGVAVQPPESRTAHSPRPFGRTRAACERLLGAHGSVRAAAGAGIGAGQGAWGGPRPHRGAHRCGARAGRHHRGRATGSGVGGATSPRVAPRRRLHQRP